MRNSIRNLSVTENGNCLDTGQLEKLERSFRSWANASKRHDHQLSRNRILLIFMIIRYTAARLNEVSILSPRKNFDFKNHIVRLYKAGSAEDLQYREIQIPETISRDIKKILDKYESGTDKEAPFKVDPGHVRRKFYERSVACGFPKEIGGPDLIRKSRAVELMQSNMPLPVVQNILGHSTPNLAASYVSFSNDDIRQVAKFYIEKESQRKTSARNIFFGKVTAIQNGDVQAKIELTTIGGESVATMVTTDSVARLGIKKGLLMTAEVKAPWVILHKRPEKPECTAENMFRGTIYKINRGKVVTEYVALIADGTEICSIVTTESARKFGLKKDDPVWIIFNSFAVVLNVD